jgi:hypothetical protein
MWNVHLSVVCDWDWYGMCVQNLMGYDAIDDWVIVHAKGAPEHLYDDES